MYYPYPVADHIDEYLEAIAGHEEFVVKRDENSGVAIVNYIFSNENTFQDPMALDDPVERRLAALRRECRGITFYLDNGRIASRKLAKFHNVNERPEYLVGNIDWTRPHWILDKLDGSMISPYLRRDGRLEWHTKMGLTEVAKPVANFVESSPLPYSEFVREWIEQDYTPVFEWCSSQNRIVIAYSDDNLILTTIRHNVTGELVSYPLMVESAALSGIPVVKAMDSRVDDPVAFLKKIGDLKGVEGVVVRFDDGSMCKIKAEEYVLLHRSRDSMRFEKSIWTLILSDSLDDAKAFMLPEDRQKIEEFAEAFGNEVFKTSNRLNEIAKAAKVRHTLKGEFAREYVNNPDICVPIVEKGLLFSIWDGCNPVEAVLRILRKNTNSQTQVDSVRSLVGGIDWKTFYLETIIEDD